MLGDVRARKYSKTGARTRSILEKFAFDTTLEIFKERILAVPAYFGTRSSSILSIPTTYLKRKACAFVI